MKKKLQLENWALDFVGKRIENKEYQGIAERGKGSEISCYMSTKRKSKNCVRMNDKCS